MKPGGQPPKIGDIELDNAMKTKDQLAMLIFSYHTMKFGDEEVYYFVYRHPIFTRRSCFTKRIFSY